MELRNESKTLFIPLLSKALMSKNNLFLKDLKAEEIVSNLDNDLLLLKQSKWTLNVKNIDEDPNQNSGSIVVSGGTFYNFNPEEAYTDDLDPDTGLPANPINYLLEGYTAIPQEMGEGVTRYIVELDNSEE